MTFLFPMTVFLLVLVGEPSGGGDVTELMPWVDDSDPVPPAEMTTPSPISLREGESKLQIFTPDLATLVRCEALDWRWVELKSVTRSIVVPSGDYEILFAREDQGLRADLTLASQETLALYVDVPAGVCEILPTRSEHCPNGPLPEGVPQMSADADPEDLPFEPPQLLSRSRFPGLRPVRPVGETGTVWVKMRIDTEGKVCEPCVESTDNPLLDRAAVLMAYLGRWKPAVRDDEPIEIWIVTPIIFQPH